MRSSRIACRLSYLRTSPAFLASALSSDKARFVLYSGLNPLCAPPSPTDGAIKLHTVSWADVQAIVGAASVVFTNVDGKNEQQLGQVSAFFTADERTRDALTTEQKAHHFINQPPLVFLGVDERSAPEEAKSLPLTKPDENSTLASHSPYGVPYWALDVTTLKDLRDKFEKTEDKYEFVDMRAGMASIPGEEASIAAEGRALVDWNKRNVVSRSPVIPT
jgi:NAD+ diphosphatase